MGECVDRKTKLKEMIENCKTPFDPIMLQPPYVGIATFFRLPHQKDLKGLDIAIIGVPFDGGLTNRTGARHAPRAVRNQSCSTCSAGLYNHQTKLMPTVLCNIADIGDVLFKNYFSLEEALKSIEEYYKKIAAAGVVPIAVGGDHSITYPMLKVLGAKEPLALIHFDSHCDTGEGGGYGSRFHHGSPFSNAAIDGVINPKKTIQIGTRGKTELFWQFSQDSGMSVIHVEEFYEKGWKKVVDEIRKIIGTSPAYLSFDIDVLDPAYAPGTGTPEPGGITMFEAQQVLRGLRGLNIIGGDVVEISPPFDCADITSLNGAGILFEILCLVAENRFRKKEDS